jgi:UDP-N-acetylmuramoyl-L-alanyl-D-glutamate--2,6-diaminopimelate ligase
VSGVALGRLMTEVSSLEPRASAPVDERLPITGIAYDSRRVQPGNLFVCLEGLSGDGHDFAPEAWRRGASLVVGERPVLEGGPYLALRDSRSALALLSCAFFDHPSRAMRIAAVTGTNGKTSICWMLDSILRRAGLPSAVMGTLGSGSPGLRSGSADEAPSTGGVPWRDSPHTTPEAPELQGELARWREAGTAAGAIEVSSHALAFRRSYGTRFATVVFTNLTPEHLDFHRSMEEYRRAKALLFHRQSRGTAEPPCVAVLNADDPASPSLIEGSDDFILWYGYGAQAHVRVDSPVLDPAGIRFTARWPQIRLPGGAGGILPEGEAEIRSSLLGSFQIENLLAAFAAALGMGVEPATAASGLAALRKVPGRMERIEGESEFVAVIDYAHTPDALARALRSLRPFTPGRLILVFGCGGDRDRGKRPLMGEAAARWADRIVLTDDNPRSEEPASIRAQVRAGMAAAGERLLEEGDREGAIRAALREARSGDTVLIAGKGHETVQIRGNEAISFEDGAVARRILREMRP